MSGREQGTGLSTSQEKDKKDRAIKMSGKGHARTDGAIDLSGRGQGGQCFQHVRKKTGGEGYQNIKKRTRKDM